MIKHSEFIKQSNQYDKIVRENLEVTLPVITKDILGIDVLNSEELPDDLQHTKERKPDVLKRITDVNGQVYILHIEFQLSDEKQMVYRMAEYHLMLMRKYKTPVIQYVIFLKDAIPTMPTSFKETNHSFRFLLLRIADTDYRIFLRSESAEVNMLGILAKIGGEDKDEAIGAIIHSIQSHADNGFEQARYFNQLRILVQLRSNYEQQFEKIMESVSTFFKEENDYLYRKGEAIGEARGEARGEAKGEARGEKKGKAIATAKAKALFVKNLIIKLGLSDQEIRKLVKVDAALIKTIRATLAAKHS